MVPSENIKPFETKFSTMWFDTAGIFFSVTKKDQPINKEALKTTFDYIQKNKPNERICWIGDVTNVSDVDKEARLFAGQETPKFIKALAVITNSSISKMIADLFLLVYKPSYPTKLFTSEEDAIAWIKKYHL
jgi:hypothetical protein